MDRASLEQSLKGPLTVHRFVTCMLHDGDDLVPLVLRDEVLFFSRHAHGFYREIGYEPYSQTLLQQELETPPPPLLSSPFRLTFLQRLRNIPRCLTSAYALVERVHSEAMHVDPRGELAIHTQKLLVAARRPFAIDSPRVTFYGYDHGDPHAASLSSYHGREEEFLATLPFVNACLRLV